MFLVSALLKRATGGLHNSEEPKTLNVMIFGPPASGKGTQCRAITTTFGVKHISSGSLIRNVLKDAEAGSKKSSFSVEIQTQMKELMAKGELIPSELVTTMVTEEMEKCNHAETFGWLLDGFPRTGDQVDALEAKGLHPDLFILLQVPDKDLVARVINRRMDPTTGKIYSLLVNPPPAEIADSVIQREDDTEVAIVTRLKNYHTNLNAVSNRYVPETVMIDGGNSIEKVSADIIAACQKKLDSK